MNISGKEAAAILLYDEPEACASLTGSSGYSSIKGEVAFYSLWQGSLVYVMVTGLPEIEGACSGQMFGFHLHEGDSHYNPGQCPHPMHAGDFPALLANNGCAMMLFYTERFHPKEAIGKKVVIHQMPDDFRSQPSGNSGEPLASGDVYAF